MESIGLKKEYQGFFGGSSKKISNTASPRYQQTPFP
jgi:hypothetical protein